MEATYSLSVGHIYLSPYPTPAPQKKAHQSILKGEGEFGKLGHGNREASSHPKRVRGALDDKAVTKVALGRYTYT